MATFATLSAAAPVATSCGRLRASHAKSTTATTTMSGGKMQHQQQQQASVSLSHYPRRAAAARRGSALVVAAAPEDAAADEGDDAMEVFSPSKINLFLRIVRRREDGFHDLASLFHVIDLGDDMKFAKSSSTTRDTLVCSDDTIPLDGSNLVIKALDLFRAKTGVEQFFWVELVKKVPHGAGLGGGSGNAATALWAGDWRGRGVSFSHTRVHHDCHLFFIFIFHAELN